jgi:simple sugar transport system permease protein
VSARARLSRAGTIALPVVIAFAVALLLLQLAGAPPFEALGLLWDGSVGSAAKISDTLAAWVPLTLAAAGLVVTFAGGLWNIGVEGQIVAGAVVATWVAREVPGPDTVLISAMLVAGVVGGAVWALLAGVLKTRGGVNEIFGGLGLDFVASGLAIYLIIGPWKREGVASTSGTDLFRPEAWMRTIGVAQVPVVPIALTVVAVVLVYVLMRGTRFGLRLKAVGKNPRSAHLLGIPTERYTLAAFLLCGGLAGLAGAILVSGVFHKLVPSVSGGYGFLGILVVLLAGYRAAWIAPISFFFATVAVGSTQLSLRLDLDSSLGGVLQGVLVLFVVLFGGWRARRTRRHTALMEPGALMEPEVP